MTATRVRDAANTRNWLNVALLAAFGVAAGLMLLLIGASFFVPPMVDRWVQTYTDPAPMEISGPPLDPAEREAAGARLDEFLDRIDTGDIGDPEFVLDEAELRALLFNENDPSGPRVGMEVDVLPGRIRTAVSMPIDDNVTLGPWRANTKGRYLNAYVILRLGFANRELDVRLESVETVDGTPFPGWAAALIDRRLDEERPWDSPDVRDVLQKLERIELRDGTVVMRAREPNY